MIYALLPPLACAVYNFGWRCLLICAFASLICWAVEYLFTSHDAKPASMASLVTGIILGLILPPNIPYWQTAVGAGFCIVFGKMVFGGFGRNIFNPAMLGRCFLYICFPATVAATWHVPFQQFPAGFIRYTTSVRCAEADAGLFEPDGVTSATTLAITKKLNLTARIALKKQDRQNYEKALNAFSAVPLMKLFIGNINGSAGETSALLILISFLFLAYAKIITVPLFVGPLLGLAAGKILMKLIGTDVMPFFQGYLTAVFGGGTMFAVVFMITEPVTAPVNRKARWIYAFMIGFIAAVIRTMSVFNAGLMFSLLLGNAFGPVIEIACDRFDAVEKRPEQ